MEGGPEVIVLVNFSLQGFLYEAPQDFLVFLSGWGVGNLDAAFKRHRLFEWRWCDLYGMWFRTSLGILGEILTSRLKRWALFRRVATSDGHRWPGCRLDDC